MRTNIDIDDAVLDAAMQAGPFKTKKEAVDAGLRLLARQAACREILRWEGKLSWDGDSDSGAENAGERAPQAPAALALQEPSPASTLGTARRRHAGR